MHHGSKLVIKLTNYEVIIFVIMGEGYLKSESKSSKCGMWNNNPE